MHIININDAKFIAAFGIKISEIITNKDHLNFGAVYGKVLPGEETFPHRHYEIEAFIILSGIGEIITNGRKFPALTGSIIVFESFESHLLKNIGSDVLCFVSFYWPNIAYLTNASKNNSISRLKERPVFIFSTPPTPNGDLHLGHLSGPYLGADILVRFLRATGIEAYHLTGSDDYQSYVVERARIENSTPKKVASFYAAEIKETLKMMNIKLDQYIITSEASEDPKYVTGLQSFFSRVVNTGVKQEIGKAIFDSQYNTYLYEADVFGNCPTCNSLSRGNICENCGEPNTCIELINPRSNLSNATPYIKEIKRYALNLIEFKHIILKHHHHAKISPKLRKLAKNILDRQNFYLPITHQSTWGISPVEYVSEPQIIWVWVEMAYGFLYSIAELGKRLGQDWNADYPNSEWKIIHFFGYDNSFYHSILFPILYHLAFPDWQCDIDYNHNEFYLLDNMKFSTSKRHVIWGKDILKTENVDAIRYYLALTRSEESQTNFNINDFHKCVNEILIGEWQTWLISLGQRLEDDFFSIIPEAGFWSANHIGYLNSLENRLSTIRNFYDVDGFSMNHVVKEINYLVKDAIQFAASNLYLRNNMAIQDEYRTSIVLEITAARLLAQVTIPLLPQFSNELFNAIGLSNSEFWFDSVKLAPTGNFVDIKNRTFFDLPNKNANKIA